MTNEEEIKTLKNQLNKYFFVPDEKVKTVWLHNKILNVDIPAEFRQSSGVIFSVIRKDIDWRKYNPVLFNEYTVNAVAEDMILQEWEINLQKTYNEEMDNILGVLDGQ